MSVLTDRVGHFDATSEWLPRHSFDQCANQEESILQNTTASEIQVLDTWFDPVSANKTLRIPKQAHENMFFQSIPSKSLQVSLSVCVYPHLEMGAVSISMYIQDNKSNLIQPTPDLKALWRTDSLPVLCQWTSQMPFPAWMWGGHQVQTLQTSTWTWGCECCDHEYSLL